MPADSALLGLLVFTRTAAARLVNSPTWPAGVTGPVRLQPPGRPRLSRLGQASDSDGPLAFGVSAYLNMIPWSGPGAGHDSHDEKR